jgi:hypothetical protein
MLGEGAPGEKIMRLNRQNTATIDRGVPSCRDMSTAVFAIKFLDKKIIVSGCISWKTFKLEDILGFRRCYCKYQMLWHFHLKWYTTGPSLTGLLHLRQDLMLHISLSCLLLHLGILWLGQAMLLQQCIDLIRAPQVVVNFAFWRPSDCRKLDCTMLVLESSVTCD